MSQAVGPPLLCLASAVAEASSARHRTRGQGTPTASHPALDALEGPLRATFALVWAAGAPSFSGRRGMGGAS